MFFFLKTVYAFRVQSLKIHIILFNSFDDKYPTSTARSVRLIRHVLSSFLLTHYSQFVNKLQKHIKKIVILKSTILNLADKNKI